MLARLMEANQATEGAEILMGERHLEPIPEPTWGCPAAGKAGTIKRLWDVQLMDIRPVIYAGFSFFLLKTTRLSAMKFPRYKAADLLVAQILLVTFLVTLWLLWNFLADEIHLAVEMIGICFIAGSLGFLLTTSFLRFKYKMRIWLTVLVGIFICYVTILCFLEFLYGIPIIEWGVVQKIASPEK